MRFFVSILFIFAVTVATGQPARSRTADIAGAVSKLNIAIDLDNAQQTVQLLEQKEVTAAQLKEWISLPGTQALVSKVKSRPDSAVSAMKKTIAGLPLTAEEKKFQFEFIRKNITQQKEFIQRLLSARDSMKTALIEGLGKYLPKDSAATITLNGLMGGYSSGFAFTNDPTAFYVGLHFYKSDIIGVTMAAMHELFHTLQSANYDYHPVLAEVKKVDTAFEAPYYLLTHLYLEGSAQTISDGQPYLATSPYLKNEYDHLAVNNYRRDADFYLLERMILDLYRHPGEMNFDHAYSILFDWNWNNPAYFAGKEMMTALVRANGESYIVKSLKRNALYFVKDYIALQRAGKQTGLYTFSPEFSTLVDEMLGHIH